MKAGQLVILIAVAALAFLGGYRAADSGGPLPEFRGTDDPAEALRKVLRLQDADDRAGALVAFFREASPEDAATLREVLGEDPHRVDELVEILFAGWWARFDPAAALEHPVHPPWPNRHPWLRTVVRAWTLQDPVAVAAAVNELPGHPTKGRVEAIRTLLDSWLERSDQDPAPLFGLLTTLEVEPRGRAMERFLRGMIDTRGTEATASFVEALPEDAEAFGGSIRAELMGRLGAAMARDDVARARAWAAKHGEGRKGFGVLLHLAFYWGLSDGPSAMQWALELEPSEYKQRVIQRVFLSYQRSRREEAGDWLGAQEPTPDLRHLFTSYLNRLTGEDPARALELALGAQDSETRNQLLRVVGRSWLRSDPEAARAWMDGADLPAEVTEGILKARAAPRPKQG